MESGSALGDVQRLHDQLTGLPNRELLVDRLEHALARAQRQGGVVGVFFIDLDGFKSVNDTHGHDTGDRLLVAVAEQLSRTLRASDTVARMGGDEFVLICEGNEEWAAEIIRGRIATALAQAAGLDPDFGEVAASVGDAWSTAGGRSALELMAAADAAMYLVKRNLTR